MWRVIIQCSAEAWQSGAVAFKEIAARYPATLLSSKKMKGTDSRTMEYQLDDINDAEAFLEECGTLNGFVGTFESL